MAIRLLSPQYEPAEIPRGGYWVAENGVLINREDPEGLAQALRYLAGDENLRARLGRSAQEWVSRHCALEHVATRYLEVYREIVEDGVKAA